MNFFAIIVAFGLCIVACGSNIILKAKFMGNWRVEGDGYSVLALSVSQCLAICNKNKSCDAITFNDEIKKCRLFKRCAPLEITAFNSHHLFYAKRPPVSDSGYYYEEKSDTCLKLADIESSHQQADQICLKDKGYLAVLYSMELRQLAKKILQDTGITDAWINPPFKSYEKYAKNHDYRRKRSIQAENEECWLVKNFTVVKQATCENEKRLSICQIPTY